VSRVQDLGFRPRVQVPCESEFVQVRDHGASTVVGVIYAQRCSTLALRGGGAGEGGRKVRERVCVSECLSVCVCVKLISTGT
jgi:hypothetical protein